MPADAQSFVERFTAMWRDPQPDTFSDLFHEDGTLFHPTMEAPIGREAVPEYVNRLKALAPDIRLEVRNWAASGDVVLIEWTITATYGGEQMEVEGADRFTLRGDRAVEGVAYFDTLALWGKIDPSMQRGHLLDAAAG
jgi:limonene-1,2-epoxide hydrolase